MGYGHGEEMLYLEILDDNFDDIYRTYGDYKDVLENFISIRINSGYVLTVLRNFTQLRQSREAHDWLDKLLNPM